MSIIKKREPLLFCLAGLCLVCSGCSISFSAHPSTDTAAPENNPVSATIQSKIVEYTDAPDETASETDLAPHSLTPLSVPDEKELAVLQSLDNGIQNWGYGTKDRDSDNRPNGCVQYQNQYGSYDADFVKDNTPSIYLTFDEGYENGYTSRILDILKEKQVSAVFFVTMPYVKENPQLIDRMIAEGHIVGNHSVSHPESGFPSLSLQAQANEIVELHNYVEEEFGYEMYLFRYPKGMFSEQSMALLQNMGYRSVFWSFAYRDWVTDSQPDEAEALQKMTSQVHNGAIYLLHAVSSTNTSILAQFIDSVREKGYEFCPYPAGTSLTEKSL